MLLVILKENINDKQKYLKEYLITFLLSDILEHYNVKNDYKIEELLKFLASSSSSLTNTKK
ncbi:hypothetical protein [Mycoplasmopsis fermentans]|uniref:Uncharacterized protein n=2 Tax=Mycoplasmopsis fermentans TaxID=2115 RepID=C4XFH5_MYCFP|nr:hypothetical protein [Mycoplasmopsis fermentans]ADV34806.1 Conserved Hypothetical Protein [Mycoplasmopsis fermentans M64]BAH69897.1 hypothetical protein MBIO_0632 [Mycoplasmopsis fermentans PG18]VEU63708.1 Uncharacterised protein [Mycoplasmopsis fermentans]VEU67303.1 Uncharacterised protein [Mesomycoplasma conjunctivae]